MTISTTPPAQRPGYKHTKVGWIPADWESTTVGKAFKIENGPRKPISELVRRDMQGPYPYFGPTKIQDYINEFNYEGRYALIAEDGDHFLKYRERKMTQIAEGKFNVNNHAHALREGKNSTVDWFYYFFQHRSTFAFLTRQGAGRYKLNKSSLQALPIPLPPLPEQQRIATLLTTWDRAITTTQALIKQLEARKRGLMQRLLTGEVRLPGFSSAAASDGEGEWKEVSLGDIAKRVTTRNKELNDTVVTISAQRGFVKQEDFFNKRVASNTLSGYYLLKRGQFAYNKSYSKGYPMGAFKRLDAFDKAVVTTLYICFSLKANVNSDFLLNYFEGGRLVKNLMQIAQEGGRAHGLLNIGLQDFFDLKISLPPLEEQAAIAKVLTVTDQEIDIYRKKLKQLKRQKRGLMQQLLTGQKRLLA